MQTQLSSTDAAIDACTFSTHYARMFAELVPSPVLPAYSPANPVLSKALFFHLAKLRHAGWQYAAAVRRERRHSLSDVFQDLLAYYLRAALEPHGLQVELEAMMPSTQGNKPTQVDIVVRKNQGAESAAIFAIEVKTTIGRGRIRTAEDKQPHIDRLEQVALNFGIPSNNVIFVYEEPSNNTGDFQRLYWTGPNKRDGIPFPGRRMATRPADPLYGRIYPLFFGTDPKTWDWSTGPNNTTRRYLAHKTCCPPVTRERFIQEAEMRIVTPIEEVIELILSASRHVTD